MPFDVADSTLESLEWARLIDELRTCCRTPQGRARLSESSGESVFAADERDVRARLRETTEARDLLDRAAIAPLGGCADLAASLSHAEKGGVLEPAQLIDVRTTLEAIHATLRFFRHHHEQTPALSELSRRIEEQSDLEAAISRSLDTNGEVRDAASTTLAKARREAHSLSSDLQNRIQRALQNADIQPHLSDHFYTVRNGRFVLPVRADAKGRVRGIVHDASRSGTTLFIEPGEMVELNNRHRQAELTVEREILRVLRELSAAVARNAIALRTNLEWIAYLDLAIARGQFSRITEGVEPEVGRQGIFELDGIRHPLIPAEQCVSNDLRLGKDFTILILSGPNAGGKTVALKSVALAALMVRAGLHVPANPGARVDLVDRVLADIGDHQDIQESLSTFSAAMANLAEILRGAGPNTLVCLDEIGVGTDPSEGAAIAQATLESLADSGARVVTTTHYNLLKEMAEIEERFENASVEFDPKTLAPTYRVRIGSPGASSATTVAARMGMPQRVLDRAAGLLNREDRRLDQMLAELGASRALLESEQLAAEALRAESEQTREEYRTKLARLQERRDKLFGDMRRELDDSFRDAHSEVARIIAELQRQPSSRRAATARSRLEELRDHTAQTQTDRGITPDPSPAEATTRPIDWPRARVGDSVRAPGGGAGTLLSLPDRKGRVMVQIAGAKLTIGRDQLGSADPKTQKANAPGRSTPSEPTQQPTPPSRIGGIVEADLRGLRVDEALDRLDLALDLAAAEGRDEIRVIHGIGTGALRSAVREHLPHSHYVVECVEATREEGGAGATRGILKKD
jgi:DNA mismatch repair protein MutS2